MHTDHSLLGVREDHPSYAILGFHRTTGHKTNLFGSSIAHNDTIQLTLKKAYTSRSLNQDWYFAREPLFKVEMSYSQFAELITSLNIGDGVPVTLRYTREDGYIEDCPFVDRAEKHLNEFKDHLSETYQHTRDLIKKVSDLFASKKTFNKKDQAEILQILSHISADIGGNQDFQLSQFQEQMEKTVTDGKAEVECFFQNKINQFAQYQMLQANAPCIANASPVEISGAVEAQSD